MQTAETTKRPKRQLIDDTGRAAAPPPSPPQPVDDVPAQLVPLALIDASDENPRKDFDQERLQELADDIRQFGVLQAIGLRKRGVRYEIVWGERRVRASRLAGKTDILARVGEWDDRTAEVLRFSENKHENLSALELAAGYQRLMDRHRFTVAQLAEQVKRKEPSVRDVLALNKLGTTARRAFNDKKLNASTAMLVAHLPHVVQTELLFEQDRRIDNGEDPFSFRELKDLIATEYVIELEKARFELHDAQLRAEAGACTGCTWNDKGSCRNRPCFAAKTSAWLERQKKNGRKVLTDEEVGDVFPYGDRPADYGDYVLADDVDGYSEDDDTWRDKLGKDAQKHLVLARAPSGAVVDLIPRSALPKEKSARERNKEEAEGRRIDSIKSPDQTRADFEFELQVRREAVHAVLPVLIEKIPDKKGDDTAFFRVLAFAICNAGHFGSGAAETALLLQRMGAEKNQTPWGFAYNKRGTELRAAVFHIAMKHAVVQAEHLPKFPEAITEACGLMGVDLEGYEKAARKRLKKARAKESAS